MQVASVGAAPGYVHHAAFAGSHVPFQSFGGFADPVVFGALMASFFLIGQVPET
ncbi:hypothetical protein ACWCV5_32295 [Streptomyces tubercidicus]